MSNTDVDDAVSQAIKLSLPEASLAQIEERIDMTLQADTSFDDIYGTNLGESRAKIFLDDCRKGICDGGKLKEEYARLLDSGDTTEILKSLATAILTLLNPALAVPSVAVLAAVWLLKLGLNQWCK
jgi:hypothetical protein